MQAQRTGIQAFRRRPTGCDVADSAAESSADNNADNNANTGSRGASRVVRERPDGPLPLPCTPLHLNLLLVGRQGVGKSTLMLNACARWGMEPKDLPVHAFDNQSAGMAMKLFETQPDSMACCVPEMLLGPDGPTVGGASADCQPERRALRIKIQDTPGYGDEACKGLERPSRHLPAVLRWVLRQRHRDLAALNGAALSVADGGRRLGVLPYSPCLCIFMVDPNRFASLDVEYLWALSRVVGVLPVLARADTLTAHERQQMRERVAEAMEQHTSADGLAQPVRMYRFSAQALESLDAGALPSPPIPSVMACRHMTLLQQQPTEPRKGQEEQQQQQERSEEKEACQVHESKPSNCISGSPAAAAAAGRWVAVRRLCGDGGAVLSAADPSLSDTELLLGLLRADLWGLAADARDRHIEFSDWCNAAHGRLRSLERDLLRHVAWRRLGAARPTRVAGALPSVRAVPPGKPLRGLWVTTTVAAWVAVLLGLAAVALCVWLCVQEGRMGARLALVSQQQAELHSLVLQQQEALQRAQGAVKGLETEMHEQHSSHQGALESLQGLQELAAALQADMQRHGRWIVYFENWKMSRLW